jgi:hypothetical protein
LCNKFAPLANTPSSLGSQASWSCFCT